MDNHSKKQLKGPHLFFVFKCQPWHSVKVHMVLQSYYPLLLFEHNKLTIIALSGEACSVTLNRLICYIMEELKGWVAYFYLGLKKYILFELYWLYDQKYVDI